MRSLCRAPGCDRPVNGRGLCSKHYALARQTGGRHPLLRAIYLAYRKPTSSLVCICVTPEPTLTDMCAHCKRVIASLVHARRARKRQDNAA